MNASLAFLVALSVVGCGGHSLDLGKTAPVKLSPTASDPPNADPPRLAVPPTTGAACDGAAGAATLLVPGLEPLATSIAVGPGHVYFTWSTEEGKDARLLRLSKGGGPIELVGGDPYEVAASKTSVLWVDATSALRTVGKSTVRELPKGRPLQLSVLADDTALITIGGDFYGNLYRVFDERVELLSDRIGPFVGDGDDLYFLSSGHLGTLHRRPLAEGTPVEMSKDELFGPLAVDEARVYAQRRTDPPYELNESMSIRAYSKEGGAPPIDIFRGHAIGALVSKGAFLYGAVRMAVWSCDYSLTEPGGVVRIAKDGSGSTIIQEEKGDVVHLVSDDDTLYWIGDKGLYCLRLP